jgi:hypothetical protein
MVSASALNSEDELSLDGGESDLWRSDSETNVAEGGPGLRARGKTHSRQSSASLARDKDGVMCADGTTGSSAPLQPTQSLDRVNTTADVVAGLSLASTQGTLPAQQANLPRDALPSQTGQEDRQPVAKGLSAGLEHVTNASGSAEASADRVQLRRPVGVSCCVHHGGCLRTSFVWRVQ